METINASAPASAPAPAPTPAIDRTLGADNALFLEGGAVFVGLFCRTVFGDDVGAFDVRDGSRRLISRARELESQQRVSWTLLCSSKTFSRKPLCALEIYNGVCEGEFRS